MYVSKSGSSTFAKMTKLKLGVNFKHLFIMADNGCITCIITGQMDFRALTAIGYCGSKCTLDYLVWRVEIETTSGFGHLKDVA